MEKSVTCADAVLDAVSNAAHDRIIAIEVSRCFMRNISADATGIESL
jgi:hypothetical protein